MNQYAYVTMLGTDNYLLGVLGLFYSLQKVKTIYPFLVLVSECCSEKSISILKEHHIQYIIIPDAIFQLQNEQNLAYKHTLKKLYMFALTNYQKICFLDADSLILKNCDHFFLEENKNHFFYRIDDPGRQTWSIIGNFLFITPDINIYNKIFKEKIYLNYTEDELLLTHLFFPSETTILSIEEEVEQIYYKHDRARIKYWMIDKVNINNYTEIIDQLIAPQYQYLNFQEFTLDTLRRLRDMH